MWPFSKKDKSEKTEDTFSFDKIEGAKSLEITEELQSIVQSAGEENFPDDEGVTFPIAQAVIAHDIRYVEVIPSRDTGYEKYIFELSSKILSRNAIHLREVNILYSVIQIIKPVFQKVVGGNAEKPVFFTFLAET